MAPLFNKIATMRKLSLFVVCLSIILLASCGDGGKKAPKDNQGIIPEVQMSVAKQDTTEVMQLTTNFISALKAKDIDNAMSMLYYLDKDEIASLPASIADMQRQVLTRFSGKDYRIEFVQFNRETDSKVKTFVALDGKKGPESNPNEIGFVLRPVRKNNTWYLTTDDTESDGNPSEIPN